MAGDPRAGPSPAHLVLDTHNVSYAPLCLVLNSQVSTADYLPFSVEENSEA